MLPTTNDGEEGNVRRCRGECAPRPTMLARLLGVEHKRPDDAEERDAAEGENRCDIAECDHLREREEAGTPEERSARHPQDAPRDIGLIEQMPLTHDHRIGRGKTSRYQNAAN